VDRASASGAGRGKRSATSGWVDAQLARVLRSYDCLLLVRHAHAPVASLIRPDGPGMTRGVTPPAVGGSR
jgi:hypothetical protein